MNRPALTSIPASSLAFGEGRSSPKTYAAKSLEGSYIFPLCITFFGSVADLNATPVAHALPNLSKLVGLVALCPACHNAKHFGLAQMKGQEQAALDQLEKVNRWTQDEFDLYIDEVFSEWRRRSEHKWIIDLSFLKENFGIEVKGESAQNRAVRGVAAYEVIKQHRETSSEFLKNKEIFISDSKEAGVKSSAAEREAVKKPNWSEAAALTEFTFAKGPVGHEEAGALAWLFRRDRLVPTTRHCLSIYCSTVGRTVCKKETSRAFLPQLIGLKRSVLNCLFPPCPGAAVTAMKLAFAHGG